ncbi:hypothetical protein LIL_30061 (plasmid) [Leptospira interrogans serovar Linhai str. 56609]|nr:hypothetical protein LIL_30061 [Leptospira interrogans serovar Linhai str. 56609]
MDFEKRKWNLWDQILDLSKTFIILKQYSNDSQKHKELEAKLKYFRCSFKSR